jgi:glycolate oxidase FAD binding subunit
LPENTVHPRSPEELAGALAQAAARRHTIALGGKFTKNAIGGPVEAADCTISTRCMSRVLQYEPGDLTISVEAGMPWADLESLLADKRQMVPLDPPFGEQSTVGGVIASNLSGPRRRLYGTARDLVIGMKYATLEGKIVQSGGMVVKNVAGLDTAKLLIGSLGTLAAIASVNFKLAPTPAAERSFLLRFDTLAEATSARNAILKSYLQPAAIDLLSPAVAAPLGAAAWMLAFQAGGNPKAMERYEREIAAFGEGVVLEGDDERELWTHIREFVPAFLKRHPGGAVARVSCPLSELDQVLKVAPRTALARAGSGVVYAAFLEAPEAARWVAQAAQREWPAVVEFSAADRKKDLDLWPAPGPDKEIMLEIKRMFDPERLLNRGRYYRHF